MGGHILFKRTRSSKRTSASKRTHTVQDLVKRTHSSEKTHSSKRTRSNKDLISQDQVLVRGQVLSREHVLVRGQVLSREHVLVRGQVLSREHVRNTSEKIHSSKRTRSSKTSKRTRSSKRRASDLDPCHARYYITTLLYYIVMLHCHLHLRDGRGCITPPPLPYFTNITPWSSVLSFSFSPFLV